MFITVKRNPINDPEPTEEGLYEGRVMEIAGQQNYFSVEAISEITDDEVTVIITENEVWHDDVVAFVSFMQEAI